MSVLAIVEIKTDNVAKAKEQFMEMDYVLTYYELMSQYNMAIIVELESEDALFEFLVLKVRTIPGIEETKTHIIQDGIVI